MKQELMQLGLEQTEINVYLALLRLGPSGVSEISKSAGIKRTLGYHILGKLSMHGLVDQVISKKNKQVYSTRHPRQLVQYAERKQRAWGRKAKSVEGILPELLSMYKVGEKPVIRYQEGVQGVITLFEESLESKSDILSIFDIESWQNSDFWEWALTYFKERNKRKITEKLLMLDTSAARKWIKDYSGSRVYSIYKWVKPEEVTDLLQFGGEMNIYDNRVMIAFLEETKRMGVIIESTVLSNILRAMYELIWKDAEPVVFPRRKK